MLISKIIDATLNEILLGTFRAHYNRVRLLIASDLNANTLSLQYPIDGIAENSYVEVGQELMYVPIGGIDRVGSSLTVIRATRGTPLAAHSQGAAVSINPRFPRFEILSTMQEEATSWPTSLFQVARGDVTAITGSASIDLAAALSFDDINRVIKVWGNSGSGTRWIRLRGWRFEKDLFDDGSADLYLSENCFTSVRVLVARPYNGVAAWTEATNIADSGMPESVADILKYGAAWRLVNGRETRRLFTEVESEGRVAADVPVTANLTLARQLKTLRDTRVGEEIMRLRSLYGFRRG